jgi:hypothetical protein
VKRKKTPRERALAWAKANPFIREHGLVVCAYAAGWLAGYRAASRKGKSNDQ